MSILCCGVCCKAPATSTLVEVLVFGSDITVYWAPVVASVWIPLNFTMSPTPIFCFRYDEVITFASSGLVLAIAKTSSETPACFKAENVALDCDVAAVAAVASLRLNAKASCWRPMPCIMLPALGLPLMPAKPWAKPKAKPRLSSSDIDVNWLPMLSNKPIIIPYFMPA